MTDDKKRAPGVEPDVEGAIKLLRDSQDSQIRQFVAYLLGQTGDSRAIEPLIDALQDEHVGVRGAAANALGTIRDPRRWMTRSAGA